MSGPSLTDISQQKELESTSMILLEVLKKKGFKRDVTCSTSNFLWRPGLEQRGSQGRGMLIREV